VQSRFQTKRKIKQFLFVRDIARPPTSLCTMGWTLLLHPPYSRYLAPSNFQLFGPLKDILRERHFEDHDELKHSLCEALRRLSKTFYATGLQRLSQWWETCVENEEEFGENNLTFVKDALMIYINFIVAVKKMGGITFVPPLVLHSLVLTDELCTRKLRCPRNMLHLHLFVSFIMRAFMTLLKDIIFINGVGLSMNIVEKNGSTHFYDQVRQQNFGKSVRHNLNDTTYSSYN